MKLTQTASTRSTVSSTSPLPPERHSALCDWDLDYVMTWVGLSADPPRQVRGPRQLRHRTDSWRVRVYWLIQSTCQTLYRGVRRERNGE
jgi:hypothetical protein